MSKIKAGSTESTSIEHVSDTSGILELDSESGVVSFINTAGITLPAGTTAQRPASALPGSLRINTTTGYLELFYASAWNQLISLDSTPSWTTTSGSLGTIYDLERTTKTFTVVATDTSPSATLSYSVVSGSLPSGMTINSSTGVISGTANAVATDTTYNFTLRVTNTIGVTADRTFSILSKAPVTTVLTYTGSLQTYNVPAGVTTVRTTMWGAGGAGGTAGGWSYGAAGGGGGYSTGLLNVSGLSALYVVVGGAGQVNSTTSAYGGGGIASRTNSDNRYGSGGGGYSGIFNASTPSQAAALIIAGGGGGGGSSRAGTGNQGGAGGGTTGEDGYSPYDGKSSYRGRGGTQSAAGADSSCDSANASGFQAALLGGTCRINGYGGAGGGGYWGGSAGGYSESNTMGGGGGGSGYVHPTLITNGVLTAGSTSTPANSGDSLRQGAGNGGSVAGAGSNGIVIISY
jgi:hypothetical protein